MPDDQEDSRKALESSMQRLARAIRWRRSNPHVQEWEQITDRNNFAPGIAKSMKERPA